MSANVVSLKSYKMNYQVSGIPLNNDLFKSFENNFLNGEKNIGVCSTHYHSLQQKLIISVLSYFNEAHPHLKIAVVSFACDSGQLQEFTAHANATKDDGIYSFGNHFDLISWKFLLTNKLEKTISSSYDILLWEMPEIEKLALDSRELKESLENMNALYVIANRLNEATEAENALRVAQYFLNHGVKIAHLLPSQIVKPKSTFRKILDSIKVVLGKAQ